MRRLALMVALVAVWSAAARAQQPPREELERRVEERFHERVRRTLQLTPEAFEQVQAILEETREARRELAAEERRLRFETDEFLRSGGDSATARQLLARMEALRERELQLWSQEQGRLAGVLTPEQRLRFVKLREQFAEWVRDMRLRMELERRGGGPRRRPPRPPE